MSPIANIYRRVFAGPSFKPDASRDVFLISYPRSGNTWMRSIIAHALTGSPPASLKELDYIVPDIHYPLPQRQMRKRDFWVVKSHEPFRLRSRSADYRKVIYIVRDPRKVAASVHRFQEAVHGTPIPAERFAEDFFKGRYWPGSWADHVRSWLETGSVRGRELVTLRYEDLMSNDIGAFRRMLAFIGIDLDAPQVEELLRAHSIDRMKDRELMGNRPVAERNEHYFIAGGSTAGASSGAAIEQKFCEVAPLNRDILDRFGYV